MSGQLRAATEEMGVPLIEVESNMLEFTEPLAPVYLEVRGLLPTLLRISAVVARVVT